MAASTIDLVEAGELLKSLIHQHGWDRSGYAQAVGVAESTIRKYERADGPRPKAEKLVPLARGFGSKDGAKLLYRYGLDALAQELARSDIEPLKPHDLDETPKIVDLSVERRLSNHERSISELREMVERILAALERDMPGYHSGNGFLHLIPGMGQGTYADPRHALRPTG